MRIGKRHIFLGSSGLFGVGSWWRANFVSLAYADVESSRAPIEQQSKKPVVVIAGAGLTGCLTSYLLRKSLGKQVKIHVMEQSLYPSGRFGAGLRYKTYDDETKNDKERWCDLGSQVLSVINCDGGHPNACTSGHGMKAGDLRDAWELAKELLSSGIIARVPHDGELEENALDVTEERMVFEDLWAHFWPSDKVKNGLSGVMRYLLEQSKPDELSFNCSVERVGRDPEGKSMVVLSKDMSTSGRRVSTESIANAVVVALPCKTTRRLTGDILPENVVKDLSRIEYDQRLVSSFVVRVSPRLALRICDMFGPTKAELNCDDMADSIVHLLAWQDRKTSGYDSLRSSFESKLDENEEQFVDLSFTCHSTDEYCRSKTARPPYSNDKARNEFQTKAHAFLHSLLHSVDTNSSAERDDEKMNEGSETGFEIIKSRAAIWTASQLMVPMEGLYCEVEDLEEAYPAGAVFTDKRGLVLAGDYFTQSNFVGCFCSAAAAARAVQEVLMDLKR